MKNIDCTFGKMVRPLPRFGSASEALPEEEDQKAFIQKTMENAKEFEKGVTGTLIRSKDQ